MKIVLLEPVEPDSSTSHKINRIHAILASQGHSLVRQHADKSLFESIRQHQPDVVFNLASIYSWEKTNLIPAALEIAALRYSGSGLFGLSLARNHTKLFPLLLAAGVPLMPFALTHARGAALPHGFHFPITLYCDGERHGLLLQTTADLTRALKDRPDKEDVLLQETLTGETQSVYVLDCAAFLPCGDAACLEPALIAYRLLEARGLARFDFTKADKTYLTDIDLAPDPLDPRFIRLAARQGLDEAKILQTLIEHAGSDLPITA